MCVSSSPRTSASISRTRKSSPSRTWGSSIGRRSSGWISSFFGGRIRDGDQEGDVNKPFRARRADIRTTAASPSSSSEVLLSLNRARPPSVRYWRSNWSPNFKWHYLPVAKLQMTSAPLLSHHRYHPILFGSHPNKIVNLPSPWAFFL